MPRTGRGGKRAGEVSKAYANRSDLNTIKTLPVQAATGQTYGDAAEQKAAQRAIPLQGQNAGMPAPTPAPSRPMIPTAPAPSEVPTFDEPGLGIDALRQHLDDSAVSTPNALGGAYVEDPDHARMMNIVDEMANGPFASSAVRELADFMRMMI